MTSQATPADTPGEALFHELAESFAPLWDRYEGGIDTVVGLIESVIYDLDSMEAKAAEIEALLEAIDEAERDTFLEEFVQDNSATIEALRGEA